MFLHLLSQTEKDSFMVFVDIAKQRNGVIADVGDDKQNILGSEHPLHLSESLCKLQSTIVNRLKKSSIYARRTIILELATLFYQENNMTENSLQWLRLLGNDLGVNEHQVEKLLEWSKDFNEFIAIGYMYINSR